MRAKKTETNVEGKASQRKQIKILMENDNFDATNLFNTLNIPKIKCNYYYYLVAVAWYLQTKNNCNRNTSFRTTKIQKYKKKSCHKPLKVNSF
jgi:hypothetical protein